MKIGFDNDTYLKMQSEQIRERIAQFGNKLYLEFGGKLFDDYHASRALPGFLPDSKLKMLLQLKEQAEIIIAISADAFYDDIQRCLDCGMNAHTPKPIDVRVVAHLLDQFFQQREVVR